MSAGSAEHAGNAFVSRLLDLLVPSLCLVCESPRRASGGGGVCAACWESLPRVDPGRACPRCALPDAGGLCASCLRDPFPARSAAAFAAYQDGTVPLVGAFKFRGYDLLAEPAGRRLAALAKERGLDGADRVVPIPSTARRNRERGYDPAVLLARATARALRLGFAPLLTRTRDTPAQSRLPASRRLANVRGALSASPRSRGRSILLVDDVVTTGATARVAAEALRDAGAARVDVLCFARTPALDDSRRPEGS